MYLAFTSLLSQMAINGENLSPYGPRTGAATVLGNSLAPLNILQRGDAVRAAAAARAAALKQKQAQEIAKQWAEDRKLGLDTGGLFQEAFNGYTANAQDIIGKHYADEAAGRITQAERIQNIANYKNEIEREKLLGIDKDKVLSAYETSQAAKPYRDIQGLHTALGETVIDPATGQRVRATAYDERGTLTKLDADPRTYNVDPIIGDYYKGLQASTIDEANAGRIGGIHSSSSLTYKGLLPVKRADGTWDVKRDALGRPVIGTTADELATARASNHNLNMAVSRLRNEYDSQRKANPSLPEKSDLDLFQQASQKYVSFRQADSAGRNAQPSAAGGGKPGFTLNPVSYAPGVTGGETAPTQTPFSSFFDAPALAIPSAQRGFYSPVRRPQPTYATKTNPAKTFEFKGLPANEVLQPGADGSLTHVRNNQQPIFGVAGEGVTLLRNRKTGELKHGPDNEQDFTSELNRLGPDWKLEPGVQVAVPKNKNYAAESAQAMARLQQREAAKAENQDGYVPKTTDQLEKEAFDLASGGTVQTYLPYNKSTRGSIDAQTAGAYRDYGNTVVPRAEQKLRSGQQKTKANPLSFGTPASKPSTGQAQRVKTIGKKDVFGFNK